MEESFDRKQNGVSRKPYDHRTNPCTRDCPNRKAECVKTCPEWAKYASERAERYEYNKTVYEVEQTLRPPIKRDKRGQL